MSFWRSTVIDPALDHEILSQIAAQRAWIDRDPANPRPYYHLAQLFRVAFRPDDALGLLLEAVRLDPTLAEAHVSLAEIYIVRADYPAAWRHAALAEQQGNSQAADLLRRYAVPPPTTPDSTPSP
jgi:cytochrome c-type biogenesis protein CcmH/NrfG